LLLRRWRGLPLQLFALTILPLAVLLVIVAFGSLALHQQAMRTLVGERDERATRAAAAAITEQLNHRASAIRSLALRVADNNDLDHVLTDAAFILPDFEGGLAIYDEAGGLVAATNASGVWQTLEIDRRLTAAESSLSPQGTAQFWATFPDPDSGEAVTLVAATAPNGYLVVGAFHPASLARRALSDVFSANDQATAYLIDENGRSLYQLGTVSLSDTELAQHPGVVDALRGESGTTYLSAEDGEYVIAYSPIAPVGWGLVIEEPWRAVADPMLRTTELGPLVMVPILFIALVGLWFGVRQIVQPLQSLEQKATELAWGDYDAIDTPVGGINEIQRLQSELIHMAQKVKASQQNLRGYLGAVTAGQEEERRRLARELHDDTIQSLIALNQQVQLAQLALDVHPATEQLSTMQQMTTQMIADLRRLTQALRPIYLEDLGLVAALDMLTREMGKVTAIPVEFRAVGLERRLSPQVELVFYRIVQEALSNIARHAQATHVDVVLAFDESMITLAISDNGRGFEVPESPAEMAPLGHFGLLGIQERAESIGARFVIDSAPGAGTGLTITLPIPVQE
jgi:two-component system sensor histidine kinase UhpB